jgi:hypothetical protein
VVVDALGKEGGRHLEDMYHTENVHHLITLAFRSSKLLSQYPKEA